MEKSSSTNRFGNILRFAAKDAKNDTESLFACIYLMNLLKGYKDAASYDVLLEKTELTPERKLFIEKQVQLDLVWDDIKAVSETMSFDDIKDIILLFSETGSFASGLESSTPACINALAATLLDIKENDVVADICCGLGTFLTYVDRSYRVGMLYGNEKYSDKKEISAIKSEFYNSKSLIEHANAFEVDYSEKKADKVFSNYPWNVKDALFSEDSDFAKEICDIPALKNEKRSDWLFNYLLLRCMKETGKAVAIMTNGSTSNTNSKETRKYFIENGFIEAIISLPNNLFPATSIGSTLIVLSRGNKEVMLVNAKELFARGRRKNTITHEQIEEICRATKKETDISRKVDSVEFAENEYDISPMRYMDKNIEYENMVQFGEIITEIRRGSQISGNELDANSSIEPTNVQYLMLSNIDNGMIDNKLHYMKVLEKKNERFCLNNEDLIISKIGTPAKIAIAENITPTTKIVANGNLYIVAIDKTKANPYYVKAFLESEEGRKSLEREMIGSQMKSISLERLKSIMIPMVPIEEQNILGEKYKEKLNELRALKIRIEKSIEDLDQIYDSWKKDE